MPLALEIRALTRRLRAGAAGCSATALLLDDVWLSVGDGECVAVAGPDAAGRLALLLCAAGLLRPDGGVVRVGERGAAYVAATCDLGGLTVAESLEWHRRMLGDRAVRSVAASSGIARAADLASVRVRLLAPAAARRVAIARAMLAAPSLLALDEPMAGASIDERAELGAVLRAVAAAGTAVLYSAGDASDCAVAHRVVWLTRARLLATDRAVGAPRPRAGGRGTPPAPAHRHVAEPAP